GRRRDEVGIELDHFITDAVAQGSPVVVVVHGRGQGIIKSEVDSWLRRDKRVEGFKPDPKNPGQMVVRLRG
ncbi:MAG TPA: hypothetical protein EYP24_05475, partial [bacterium (Candidatus Stahlbacteria)]|nr:hypothetical protein [Candidatus Stahlbacteria bacterium]